MTLIITVVHILVCLALIFVVLLQKGSGADMGAAFGGSSQSVFGSRGSGSFLGKLTATLATVFMITSLSLAFFTTQKGAGVSIMGVPAAGAKESDAKKTPPVTEEEKDAIPPKGQDGIGSSAPAARPADSGTKPVPAFDDPSSQTPAVPKGETQSVPTGTGVKPSAEASQAVPTVNASPSASAGAVKEVPGTASTLADPNPASQPVPTEGPAKGETQPVTAPSAKP